MVSIDPGTLGTPGTQVLSDYRYLSLGTLSGSVDVSISNTPPRPSARSASPSTRGPVP